MIRLRPYKRCDAATIVSWIGDEVSFRKWCAVRLDHYPISAEDLNCHYDTFADTDSFYQMTAFDETGIVGHLFMRFTDEKKSVLRFGFVIVDDKKRGMGLGKQMLELAIKYAFEILKVEKISLGVFENNESAYLCYKALGFHDTDSAKYYHIMDEDWKCLELELNR
jgi:RimJ/RimL family protein N-acetyltransferase